MQFAPSHPFARFQQLPLLARMAIVFLASLALTYLLAAHLPPGAQISAVTLAQAATLSNTPLKQGVLETFVQEAVLLDRVPFMDIEGNAYAYNEEATLPGVEFRAVNAAYTESTGTVNQKTETIVPLGGDADVDTFIQKTRSNVNDQRATQLRLKVKAISYKFHDAFINGDTAVDANSFDGLKKRLTGAQIVDAATNGLPVVGSTDADRQAFFDFLDALIAQCPGITGDNGLLVMNNFVRMRILAAARRLNITTTPVGRLPEPIRQSVGAAITRVNQSQLPTYNGIPMVDIGAKADGSLIIPQTETQGTSSVCSSIYAIRFGQDEGDQAITGLTNGGVDVRDLGEQQAKPALRHRVEFFTGLAVFGGKAGARGRGVLNS